MEPKRRIFISIVLIVIVGLIVCYIGPVSRDDGCDVMKVVKSSFDFDDEDEEIEVNRLAFFSDETDRSTEESPEQKEVQEQDIPPEYHGRNDIIFILVIYCFNVCQCVIISYLRMSNNKC